VERPRGRFPGSDDPLALVQQELEGRSQSEPAPRPRGRRPGEYRPAAAPPPAFPECPPDRTERTWRLVRHFIETGEAYGRTRVVSPWLFGKELSAKINTDRQVLAFIAANGHEMSDDVLGRMIEIFWKHYVTSSMTRTQILNEFLDDYWADLFDQAKTAYATDYFQRLDAEGKLHTTPHLIQREHPENYSLGNDEEYQAALQKIRVAAKLREQVAEHQLATVESEDAEQQS
jgi:hypothetical protein